MQGDFYDTCRDTSKALGSTDLENLDRNKRMHPQTRGFFYAPASGGLRSQGCFNAVRDIWPYEGGLVETVGAGCPRNMEKTNEPDDRRTNGS